MKARLRALVEYLQNFYVAGLTGLEPATSSSTERHSRPTELQPQDSLNYTTQKTKVVL